MKVIPCLKRGGELSQYFTSNAGVRQEDNLSPLGCALCVNDLQQILSNGYNGLYALVNDLSIHLSDQDVEVYITCIYIIIIVDSPNEMQDILV